MAKISTYPIISIPTIDDLLIGTDVNDLNNTKNFTIGDIGNLIGQDYVPYVGATGNVNLGSFNITGGGFIVGGGTASQFLKADGSLDSTLYTPQTRTLTINGTTYNLSANRSWDLNTIDSLTTTGTSGAATYIGKVLNIPVYQAQGSYITQLSGEATGSGPGNATVTLDNTAVISKILTGLNVTGGTIVSTDTILQAFGKVQNQINGLTTGVTYQGVWNAATNTPFLQSSVGTQGYYYVVDVAGTTNLNGITDWQVGDWAIYNGTAWQKVDNTDAVVSVNGYVGAVVLTASDVGAVPTTRTLTINGVGYNLSADRAWTVGDVRTDQSYINPSWIASLGWSKITGTPTTLAGYGITDGALNTTTLTINGTTYDLTANRTWNVGTVTSVGTSGPLTGGTITGSGTIGITQSSSTTDGYLSSTDWNTFNSKQGAISVNAPLTFVSGVIGITQSGASTDGYLSSTDWNTFNSKVSGSGTANTLPMWGSASSLINSPLSYSADTFNFQYNSATGGTVNFTNIGLTAYTYSIQMNNFGSPRSTIHSYTDGLIIQSIGGTQVSRMFANGNLILGTGTVDNGYKLEVTGDLYLSSIVNATVDTDRFIVSDGGLIKYRTGAQILSDIGAVSSVGLTMPAAFNVSNSPITSSGTIAVTAAGTAAQYIRGDGTLADFPGGGGGGGASVSYYLNGSVNQGTFGGNTYYEMSKTPIFGAGTDFNISVDGYVAQFITDAGDPDSLLIPGGNWNFETYFSASSGGGTPTFYVELYKYDGTTFTLIASNSTNPELIAFGTTVNPYFSALAVPETVLLATDRLAVRIYVSTSGRTITLHTENSNLCQVITTFTTGLTALNGLTKQVQYFSVGTSGTDFNISSSVATHTFNLPTASAVNRGALSSSDWSTFNAKQNALTLTTSGSSGPATLIGATLNIPDYGSALSGYVPYTGASQAVNLGIYSLSAGSLFVNGPSPTSGSYLGFKQATSVTTGGGGYTSISTFGTSQMNFSFAQPSGFKEFKFDVSSITTGVPGGRVYTMPDADGTIALTSNIPSGIITGTGTTNYLPKFTGTSSIGNSIVQDAGIRVDIGGDIRLTPTSAVNIQAYTGSVYTNLFYNAASHNWQTSGGATKMFLNSNDNLLIGTTTDGGQRLQVTGTVGLRASASGSSATQIPIFNADPSGTTRELVTRTPAQLLSDIGGQAALTNPVTGTGTTNYLPKFTGSTTIGNSQIIEGTNTIGINTTGYTIGAGYTALGINNATNGGALDLLLNDVKKGELYITSSSFNMYGFAGVGINLTVNNDVSKNLSIATTGNVLIGTTSDNGARLQVSGNVYIARSSNPYLTIDDTGVNSEGGILFKPSGFNSKGGLTINYSTAEQRLFVGEGGNSYFQTFYTNGSERLRITSSGNVGIGTSSPLYKLDVRRSGTTSGEVFSVGNTGSGDFGGLAVSDGGSYPVRMWAAQLEFYAGNSAYASANEAMRIFSSRNVHIGPTPASDNGARLQVSGTATVSGNGLFGGATALTGLNGGISVNGASNSGINFRTSDVLRGYVYTTSNNMWVETVSGSVILAPNGSPALTLASTGVATFSSNVNLTSAASVISLQGSSFGQIFSTNDLLLDAGTSKSILLRPNNSTVALTLASTGAATFSGNVFISKATPLLVLNDTAGAGAQIGSFGGNLNLIDNATGTKGMVMSLSTGAATFSSSVTASGGVNAGDSKFFNSVQLTDSLGGTCQGFLWTDAANTLKIGTGTVAGVNVKMTITSGGNVGIGTTSPSNKLDIQSANGTTYAATPQLRIGGGGVNNSYAQILFSDNALSDGKISYFPAAAEANRYFSISARQTESDFVIRGNGNVGIGTTSPGSLLTLSKAGSHYVQFVNSSTSNNTWIGNNSGDAWIEAGGAYGILFQTNGTERMRITSGGNVLIGTTTDNGARLQVSGNVGAYVNSLTSTEFFAENNTVKIRLIAGTSSSILSTTTNHPLIIETNNTERMRITAGGEVLIGNTDNGAYNLQCNGTGVWGAGAYVNGSDRNIKDNIATIEKGLEYIQKMNPVKFRYKPNYTRDHSMQTGFIAQELQEVFASEDYLSGLVQQGVHLSVAYQNLLPVLVKAIQELKQEIDTLKNI